MDASLVITRGDTFERSATILDKTGAPFDLTGCSVWFTIKRAGDDAANDAGANVSLFWDSGGLSNGITVIDPTSGVIDVRVDPTATATLSPAVLYVYDIQVKNGIDIETVAKAKIQVVSDVTVRVTVP